MIILDEVFKENEMDLKEEFVQIMRNSLGDTKAIKLTSFLGEAVDTFQKFVYNTNSPAKTDPKSEIEEYMDESPLKEESHTEFTAPFEQYHHQVITIRKLVQNDEEASEEFFVTFLID